MKILNLYAGIGGNRKLWGENNEVTAIEYDENIAKIYKENFPNDEVNILVDNNNTVVDKLNEIIDKINGMENKNEKIIK